MTRILLGEVNSYKLILFQLYINLSLSLHIYGHTVHILCDCHMCVALLNVYWLHELYGGDYLSPPLLG